MRPMKTIVWDVDDTLNDLMRVWLEAWFLPRHRGVKAAFNDLKVNPPAGILGLTQAEYIRSYDEFRLSGVYAALPPDRAVMSWFRANGHKYRHVALTAVPLCAAHESAGWVYRHFGKWIRTFHVVPSARKNFKAPDYDVTKVDFIRRMDRCDVFVDDSPQNLAPAAKLGVKCLLTPRPWNGAPGTIADVLAAI